MKQYLILIITLILFLGCSVKNLPSNIDQKNSNINKLTLQISTLSDNINKKEAYSLAYNAIYYSKYLAEKYEVVKPAIFHNFLINFNIKNRGLCYHYANDLLRFLKMQKYKSFKLIKIVSNPGEYFEHTSIAVTTDENRFDESIILDPWRDAGELYFSKIKDDNRYKWQIRR